jgi:DMSO reductase anchor subunit
MCQGRLSEGEAPACVQACPNEAIRIKVVKQDTVPGHGPMIPGAHDSSYTRPTTSYVSSKPVPESATAADDARLELDHGHPPLAWMLVLTQMSAGGLTGTALAPLTSDQAAITSAISLFFGFIGIALSILHLGQPLKAWRAFLGWRRSWLSREILAFGALPAGAAAIAAAWWFADHEILRLAICGTALAALAAVVCSVMVYVDTRRPFWSMSLTGGRFFGTTALLGASLCAVIWNCLEAPPLSWALALALTFRWGLSLWEISRYRKALEDGACLWHRSARILNKHLSRQIELRGLLLVMTGLVIPVIIAAGASKSWMLGLSLILTFTSQLVERLFFFTASAGAKMPGN